MSPGACVFLVIMLAIGVGAFLPFMFMYVQRWRVENPHFPNLGGDPRFGRNLPGREAHRLRKSGKWVGYQQLHLNCLWNVHTAYVCTLPGCVNTNAHKLRLQRRAEEQTRKKVYQNLYNQSKYHVRITHVKARYWNSTNRTESFGPQ